MKFLEKIKIFKRLEEAENDIENLEKKVLAPEDTENFNMKFLYSWGEPEREYTLEEKIDAIAKYLKVAFEHVEKDEIIVAKISKGKKSKK